MIETLTIPQELRDRPQWFLHIQKRPVNEDKSRASYTNEDYWSEYEAITERLSRGQYDGLGYVFSKDDPFVGVDLDGCRCPITGRLADWATDIVKKLSSYTEISPSGTGVKIFLKGKSPFSTGKKKPVGNVEKISDKNPGFEVYDFNRFFTVTGNHLEGTPTNVESSPSLDAICAKYVPKEESISTASQSHGTHHEDEQHVVERARRYIGKIPGAVSGNGGHDATFHVAGVLVVGFGLSNGDAFQLIEEWNAKCEPPWTEAELRHKIDDASKQAGPRNELRFSGDYNGNGQSQDNGNGKPTNGKAVKQKSAEPIKPKKLVSANFIKTSEIQPMPVTWLWTERVARGKITLICGNPGLGKSFLTCDLAARVSKGKVWPDAAAGCLGSVLMLSAEDDPSDTIVPRLIAADADLTKIEILQSIQIQVNADESPDEKFFNLADDIPVLREALAERSDCKLVCIDPLSAYMAGTDTHKNSDVRSVLAPLAQLASEENIAIVCVDHLNKRNQTSAAYRVAGSIAFSATARCVHFIVRGEHDPETRLMLPMKNNLGSDVSGLSFKLHSYSEGSIPCLSWSEEPVNVSLDDVLEKQSVGKKRTQTDEAKEWLADYLANGGKPAKELFDDARANGFTERPLRNAGKRLNVEIRKTGLTKGWSWFLPEDDIQTDLQDDLFPP